jgi:hypothetical protein
MARLVHMPADVRQAAAQQGITYSRVADVPMSAQYVQNVVQEYDGCPDRLRQQGMAWYPDAWLYCCDVASQYNVSPYVVAGVMAALSPQCTVSYSMKITERAISAGMASGHTAHQCMTADAVMAGSDPAAVLGRYKTRAFYWNIATAGDCDDFVTIDTWQLRIITGQAAVNVVPRPWYGYLSAAVQAATAFINVRDGSTLTAAMVQAVTWTARRGKAWH